MKSFSDEEAMNYCKSWPLQLDFDNDGFLRIPSAYTFRVDLSMLPWRELLPTANAIAFLGCHMSDAFSGGLIWVRRMHISSPDWEKVILRALERFRMGYGENRSLETEKALLFRNDESAEFAAVILLVLLAEWDAYIVYPSGKLIMTINHDDYVTITAIDEELSNDIKNSIEQWGPTASLPAPEQLF